VLPLRSKRSGVVLLPLRCWGSASSRLGLLGSSGGVALLNMACPRGARAAPRLSAVAASSGRGAQQACLPARPSVRGVQPGWSILSCPFRGWSSREEAIRPGACPPRVPVWPRRGYSAWCMSAPRACLAAKRLFGLVYVRPACMSGREEATRLGVCPRSAGFVCCCAGQRSVVFLSLRRGGHRRCAVPGLIPSRVDARWMLPLPFGAALSVLLPLRWSAQRGLLIAPAGRPPSVRRARPPIDGRRGPLMRLHGAQLGAVC
jgi:hypothetical protein